MKLIDKDTLVAEIKKEIKGIYAGREYVGIPSWEESKIDGLEKAIEILNTLEVKEVDLEKEIKDYFDNQPIITKSKGVDYQLIPSGEDIAKHFFELGTKATQKGE